MAAKSEKNHQSKVYRRAITYWRRMNDMAWPSDWSKGEATTQAGSKRTWSRERRISRLATRSSLKVPCQALRRPMASNTSRRIAHEPPQIR